MGSLNEMLKMLPAGLYSRKNYTLVYKELESYACVLDTLKECADEILRECTVVSAQSKGLEFYERMYGPARTDLDIQKRRDMLCDMLTLSSNDNTSEGIYHFFRSVGLDCEITEDPTAYDLYILSHDKNLTAAQQDSITERAAMFLPYHLTFTIDFRTIDFDGLDALGLTFAQIDAKEMTWKDFERYNGEE